MTFLTLALPTNRTIDGPRLRFEHSRAVVEYDYQYDNGNIEWAEITFNDVLAIEYRLEASCDPTSLVGSREMRSESQSFFRDDVVRRWAESVGWQDWQQSQGGDLRFKHFTLSLEDAGCVSVIAASCEIGEARKRQTIVTEHSSR